MEFLLLICITLVAWGTGDHFLRKTRGELSGIENFVFASGIGLGILAYAVFIIGLAGFLYFQVLASLLLILGLISSRKIFYFIKKTAGSIKDLNLKEITLFEGALYFILTGAFLFSLAGALAPPIGHDALVYHLMHPKIFAGTHSISHIPYTRESLWPYLTEMLFTLGIVIKSAVLSKLFHYLFGVLSTLAVYAFGKRFAGPKAGLLAAVLFYLSPGIFMQASYAYIDITLCFYVFCSLYLVLLWTRTGKLLFLITSGVFSGLALSVKLLGGIGLIPVFLILVYKTIKDRTMPGKAFFYIGLFCCAAFLCGFAWYLRSFLAVGNPVYPFMPGFFGSGWETSIGQSMGYTKGALGVLILPWDMVMHLEYFGGEQIGFLFLALLPCLIYSGWKRWVSGSLAFFSVTYIFIWYLVAKNIRFLFPVFPAVFLLLALGLFRLIYEKNYHLLKALVAGGLFFNLALAAYYNAEAVSLILGKTDTDKYLFKKVSTYEMARWANENLGDDSLIISVNEGKLFYFDAPVMRYNYFQVEEGGDIRDLLNKVKHDHENVYILIKNSTDYTDILSLLQDARPVFTSKYSEMNGKTVNYSIFELKTIISEYQ